MRFPLQQVNGDSRNPDVLPIFLRFIPKWHRHHPQFFPMVGLRATTVGLAAALVTLVPALAGIVGLCVVSTGARAANESAISPTLYLSTGALGDTALGLQTPYFEPPPPLDPATPGFTINSAPLLGSSAQEQGPGEESVFSNASGLWPLSTSFSSTLPLPGPPRPVAMAHRGFGPSGQSACWCVLTVVKAYVVGTFGAVVVVVVDAAGRDGTPQTT